MTVSSARIFVVLCGIVSIGGMVWAAFHDDRWLSLIAALAFALIVIVTATVFNLQHWFSASRSGVKRAIDLSRGNAIFMAITFGWGAFAMLGVYGLSDLWWWHSWQYGLLMLALGVSLLIYANALGRPNIPIAKSVALDLGAALALLQGLGAAVGLGFLLGTDKLSSLKPDWPANHVFLAGGIAICVLSLVAAGMHYRMRSMA